VYFQFANVIRKFTMHKSIKGILNIKLTHGQVTGLNVSPL
jgi:hypothetical protein